VIGKYGFIYNLSPLISMSDSDSVPGEVEYSDDEDYIRNESVMSARHTKIGLESVAQEQKTHLPTEA
jgi:hypothetical protein